MMAKTINSLTCFLVITLIVVGLLQPVSAAKKTENEYEDVIPGESLLFENENLLLNVDTESGEFSVCEKKTGNMWYSSPQLNDEYDEKAGGMTRTNMKSNLVVTYCDDQKNIGECNTISSSVLNDGMKIQKTENTVRFEYAFEEGFTIPLNVELKSDSLSAYVVLDDIVTKGKNSILRIEVLPFFGAGGPNEDGFILVPDGCGATIPFNHGIPVETDYKKDVYGPDSVMYKELDIISEKNLTMPMYGISRHNNAFIAIAAEGDADSKIVLDLNSSYSTAAFDFIYRNMDITVVNASSVRSKEINITSTDTASPERFCVEYLFYNGENLNYVDMADQYRKYLSATQNFTDNKSSGNSLNLSYTASAEITKSFLGVPYSGELVLTTIEDIENVNKTLEKEGVEDAVFSLNNVFSNGINSKIVNKAKILSSVGSEKDYERLNKALEKNGNSLILIADFQHVSKSGNGVNKYFSTVRGVNGAVCNITAFYPETYGPNESEQYYLLKANAINKIIKKFANSLKKTGYSIGVTSLGTELYGDYNRRKNYDRQSMLEEKLKGIKALKEASGYIYFNGANSYVFGLADYISDVPTSSSQYDFFGQDVPFIQSVLHGFVDYSSTPVNLNGNVNDAILKAVEYGSALKYELVCENVDRIVDSSENTLYSSLNSYWLPRAIETENELSDFYRVTAGKIITDHLSLANGVMKTVYENGCYTVVNYTDKVVWVDDKEIAAHGYGLFQKGEN